jgi:Novel STAND NTPase 1
MSTELFPSVAAIRDEHAKLIADLQESVPDRKEIRADQHDKTITELRERILGFIRRVRESGITLCTRSERSEAQSVINYWANTLYSLKDASTGPLAAEELVLARSEPDKAPDLSEHSCPYMGLDAFGETDAEQFLGRESAIQALLQRLASQPLVIVSGSSGSGRTSLVVAGLIPRLKAGVEAVSGSKDWRYLPMVSPESDPLAALARVAMPPGAVESDWVAQFKERIKESPDYLKQVLDTPPGSPPALLVIDRGAELFSQCSDAEARQQAVEAVVRLVDSDPPRHRALVIIRAEYVQELLHLPALKTLADRTDLRFIPPMPTPAELEEMIKRPAERVGLRYADGLIDELVRQVVGEPSALPLLQFTLWKLWNARERNCITWQVYQRIGSPRVALQRTADAVYAALPSDEHRALVRPLFLRLMQPSVSRAHVGRTLRRETLQQIGPPSLVDDVLTRYTDAGLLRRQDGPTEADDRFEVAHDILAQCWPALSGWLEDERVRHEARLKLRATRELWEENDRDTGLLLSGTVLNEQLKQYYDLEPADQEFLRRSQEETNRRAKEREELNHQLVREQMRAARRARQRSWFAIAFGVASLVAAGFLIFWLSEAKKAERKAEEAKKSAEEARIQAENARIQTQKASWYKDRASDAAESSVDRRAIALRMRQELEAQDRALATTYKSLLAGQLNPADRKEYQARLKQIESRFRLLDLLRSPGPVRPGVSIECKDGKSGGGSVCCIVQDRQGARYLVTASYVLDGPANSRVVQPGSFDAGGKSPREVATFAGLDEYVTRSYALAKLDAGVAASNDVPELGPIQHVASNVPPGTEVVLIGSGSGRREGRVLSDKGGKGNRLLTTRISTPSDGGAPVLTKDGNHLVGLLYRTIANIDGQPAADQSWVIPIEDILKDAGVELIPAPR